MRHLATLALAISVLVFVGHAGAQSNSSATVSTTPTSAAVDDPAFAAYLRVAPGIKPPQAIRSPDPSFPEDLPPDAEDRGAVVLLIGISTKGHVEAVHVMRSDQPAFEKAAVETVKKWRFKPAQQNGHPVPVQVTVEMRFRR